MKEQKMDISRRKLTVLIVDDDEISKMAAQRIFEEEGYTVCTASNGKEAVNMFNHIFEIIVIDYEMPLLNGIQTTLKIRQKEKKMSLLKSVYIIGLTGYNEKKIEEKFFRAGANAVFEKPIDNYIFQNIKNHRITWEKKNERD